MTRPLKDRKYNASQKDTDSVLKARLQQWVTAKTRLMEPEVPVLFNRLHKFAQSIQFGGFSCALKELGGDVLESAAGVYLMESLADRLCRGLDVNDISKKSLQETLYFCTGITQELLQPEFGRRLENFLALNGSKGLIRMFLGVHLSNLIFTDLYDFLATSAPEELRTRTEVIEQLCQKLATRAVRSLTDWSEPTETLVSTLHVDLNTEILRTL